MINGDGDGEEDGKILVVNDKRYKEERPRDRQKQADKRKYSTVLEISEHR